MAEDVQVVVTSETVGITTVVESVNVTTAGQVGPPGPGGGGGASDAADLTYTPADGSDWSPVPDDAAEALDQLAARPTGGGGGAVDSVNGQTGVVVLDAGDVGADPAGTASGLVATEATTRGSADTTLSTAISNEATTRASADTALSGLITAEAALARDATNLTSGTIDDARIPSGIARDSEVATAVSTAINALLAGAPGALDTLDELAAAIGDDANFAATVTTALAGKQPLDADLSAIAALTTATFGRARLTDPDAATAIAALGLGTLATLSAIGSAQITDGSIVDIDISGSAAIALTKLAAIADQRFLGNVSGGSASAIALTAAQMRTALSLVIGTDVQAFDAELAALAGLTSVADRLPYFTGSGTASLATFTAFARTLLDDADATTARATLGITGISTTVTVQLLVSDPDGQALTTSNKARWTVPVEFNGYKITRVESANSTASSSGLPSSQLRNVTQSLNVLTTETTIDVSEATSYTALTASVVNTSNQTVATGDELRVDLSAAGTGTKGYRVLITLTAP